MICDEIEYWKNRARPDVLQAINIVLGDTTDLNTDLEHFQLAR